VLYSRRCKLHDSLFLYSLHGLEELALVRFLFDLLSLKGNSRGSLPLLSSRSDASLSPALFFPSSRLLVFRSSTLLKADEVFHQEFRASPDGPVPPPLLCLYEALFCRVSQSRPLLPRRTFPYLTPPLPLKSSTARRSLGRLRKESTHPFLTGLVLLARVPLRTPPKRSTINLSLPKLCQGYVPTASPSLRPSSKGTRLPQSFSPTTLNPSFFDPASENSIPIRRQLSPPLPRLRLTCSKFLSFPWT